MPLAGRRLNAYERIMTMLLRLRSHAAPRLMAAFFLALSAIPLSSPVAAAGTTRYVATTGNDNGESRSSGSGG